MRAYRQPATPAWQQIWTAVALACVAGLLVAGCRPSQRTGAGLGHASTTVASPTGTPAPTCTPAAATGSPVTAGLPPVIEPRGWTTYTNTTYRYSLQYPANWLTPYCLAATQDSIYLYNYNPSQFHVMTAGIEPPPPLLVIGIFAVPNRDQQSLAVFYVANQKGQGPPASSQVTRSVTVAGRQALEAIQYPVQWQYGGQTQRWAYPMIAYYIADGANILVLAQFTAVDGQPSDVFTHLIATLAITG